MKRSIKLKSIALLLLLSLLILPLVSCKGNGDSDDTRDTTISTNDAKVDNYTCELPSDLNYDGEEITMISRDHIGTSDEFFVESTDTAVGSAVFRRNTAVEDMLGVKLKITPLADNATDTHYTIVRQIENEVLAGGSDTYDIVTAPHYTMTGGQQKGIFADLTDIEYLNLSKYYWTQGYNEYISVGSSQYLATGAATLTIYRYMYVTVINTEMFENNKLPSVHEAVKNNEWTMEYQIDIAKNLYSDVNGDDKRDLGDQYGFAAGARTSVDAYWVTTNNIAVKKNADNFYTYNGSVERVSNMVDKMLELFYDCGGSYIVASSKDGTDQSEIIEVFTNGKTAMANVMINSIESGFVGKEISFEIAPYPKYDKNQAEYYSHIQDQVTVLAIPISKSAERCQMIGAVMEALAAEGYKEMYKSYFENILPYRYLQTPESGEMLTLIYESSNFGYLGMAISNTFQWAQVLRGIMASEVNMVSSKMATAATDVPKQLEETNNFYIELNQQTQKQ